MKRSAFEKIFKAGIATTLVASAFVVAPTGEVNAQKDNFNKDHKKDHGKDKKPVQKVDKTKLQTTINSMINMKQADYTVDSWNKFQQALSAAERIFKDSKASQSDVTKAINNLLAAIVNLVVITTPTDVKVNTFKELKSAINNPKVENISIQKDIKVEEKAKDYFRKAY